MGRSDFERRADQLRAQTEALRENMDELLKGYNRLLGAAGDFVTQSQKPVTEFARQARGNVENVADSFSETGFPWWIPVAVIACVGAAYWFFTMFFPRTADETRDQISSSFGNMTGTQPPYTSREPSFTENR